MLSTIQAKKSAASLGADSERIIVGGGSAGANVVQNNNISDRHVPLAQLT